MYFSVPHIKGTEMEQLTLELELTDVEQQFLHKREGVYGQGQYDHCNASELINDDFKVIRFFKVCCWGYLYLVSL